MDSTTATIDRRHRCDGDLLRLLFRHRDRVFQLEQNPPAQQSGGGDSRAALTLSIANEYDRMLSTILIGNNIVNITASTLGTVLFHPAL